MQRAFDTAPSVVARNATLVPENTALSTSKKKSPVGIEIRIVRQPDDTALLFVRTSASVWLLPLEGFRHSIQV